MSKFTKTFKTGDRLTAADLNDIANAAFRSPQLPGTFQNGKLLLQAVGNAAVAVPTEIVWGKLILSVNADSIVEDAIEAEELVDGVFSPLLDDDDDQILLGAINPNLYSNIAIYDDPDASFLPIKVRVWGVATTYDFGTEEEPDIKDCMVIMNPPIELAMYEGFAKSPDNNRGQVPLHFDGDVNTVVDGGPCGEEAEPS